MDVEAPKQHPQVQRNKNSAVGSAKLSKLSSTDFYGGKAIKNQLNNSENTHFVLAHQHTGGYVPPPSLAQQQHQVEVFPTYMMMADKNQVGAVESQLQYYQSYASQNAPPQPSQRNAAKNSQNTTLGNYNFSSMKTSIGGHQHYPFEDEQYFHQQASFG